MAKRRRRTKYTWFPTLRSVGGANAPGVAGLAFSIGVHRSGDITTSVAPITADAPVEESGAFFTTEQGRLSGIVGQEYILRRIVGKLHLQFQPDGNASDGVPPVPQAFPGSAIVIAGFFVARASDANAAGVDLPIGGNVANELRESYSPLAVDTIREPWIWRRSWVLQNPTVNAWFGSGQRIPAAGWSGLTDGGMLNGPSDNSKYGSALDGPHIDAKTLRRVSNDERLWFVVSTIRYPFFDDDKANDGTITGYLDYRLLAQLRKARNRGVF